MRILRPLDRYVFTEFSKIFIATALGFPIVLIIVDLTDHLDGYMGRNLPLRDIALSYLYWLPDSMFMIPPGSRNISHGSTNSLPTRHDNVHHNRLLPGCQPPT